MYICEFDEEKICLPEIKPCEDFAQSNAYFDDLYANFFVPEFLESCAIFQGLEVHIRPEPKFNNWEHGFLHMTHRKFNQKSNDPNDRDPDYRRSERITWVKPVIDNYNCSADKGCGQVLYWEELRSGYVRPHLMMYDDENNAAFLVVLEKRATEYLLITSFYLDDDRAIGKRIAKYEKYLEQKTPLN